MLTGGVMDISREFEHYMTHLAEGLGRVAQWVVPVMDFATGGWWIIDDTGFPKKGMHSVGVARQYCGVPGKQDNCQAAVRGIFSAAPPHLRGHRVQLWWLHALGLGDFPRGSGGGNCRNLCVGAISWGVTACLLTWQSTRTHLSVVAGHFYVARQLVSEMRVASRSAADIKPAFKPSNRNA